GEPGSAELVDPLADGVAGEFVPVVDGVVRRGVRRPVDQRWFRDAVGEQGRYAVELAAVLVHVVVAFPGVSSLEWHRSSPAVSAGKGGCRLIPGARVGGVSPRRATRSTPGTPATTQ